MNFVPGMHGVAGFAKAMAPPAAATPVFKALGSIASGNSVTSLNVALPASPAAGDYNIIVLGLAQTDPNMNINTPSGWTLIGKSTAVENVSGLKQNLAVFGRAWQAGDTTVNVSFDSGLRAVAGMMSFTGVNVAAPTEGLLTTETTVNSTTAQTQQVTTLGDNRKVLQAYSVKYANSATSFTAGAGWTERMDYVAGAYATASVVDRDFATAGQIPSETALTWNATTDYVGVAFALKG